LKKFLEEHCKGIIASVIATLIGSFLIWLFNAFFRKIFAIFFNTFFKKILASFLIKYDIPIYGLFLIFIIGVMCPFLFKKVVRRKTYYEQDEVDGLIWEWDSSNYSRMGEFTALCPKCLAELVANGYLGQTDYLCSSCGFKKRLDLHQDDIKESIRIETERRERKGDWKNAKRRIQEINAKLKNFNVK
jgi:hypothetical protein